MLKTFSGPKNKFKSRSKSISGQGIIKKKLHALSLLITFKLKFLGPKISAYDIL